MVPRWCRVAVRRLPGFKEETFFSRGVARNFSPLDPLGLWEGGGGAEEGEERGPKVPPYLFLQTRPFPPPKPFLSFKRSSICNGTSPF